MSIKYEWQPEDMKIVKHMTEEFGRKRLQVLNLRQRKDEITKKFNYLLGAK